MGMMEGSLQLRERGIYSLPNGREVVVITKPEDGQPKLRGWNVSTRSMN